MLRIRESDKWALYERICHRFYLQAPCFWENELISYVSCYLKANYQFSVTAIKFSNIKDIFGKTEAQYKLRPQPHKWFAKHPSKKKISKFLNLSAGLLWRRLLPKIADRWRYRLYIKKSDSTLQQSVLCQLSFLFCPGSLKMSLNMSKLGLHIIRFISNFYGGVFL